VESIEVGGCRGSGISRLIPRISDHRFGSNGSSPDVGRPLDGFGDGLRVTLISKRKNVSQYSGEISANFVPTKNKVYHPR
jgi:hypothetical protein